MTSIQENHIQRTLDENHQIRRDHHILEHHKSNTEFFLLLQLMQLQTFLVSLRKFYQYPFHYEQVSFYEQVK